MKWSRPAQSLHETIVVHALAEKRDRIILAVSGGLDSVVLLHLMLELQPAWEWELILGHINHGLRPEADPLESQLCRDLAEQHKLQYLEEELRLSQDAGSVSEVLAREKRYAVYEKWIEQYKADALMTGHHADDQAETILYRMLTGAGIEGLTGIPRKRAAYRRPLLDMPHRDLLLYAREKQLQYYEDKSNRDQRYIRNRIRHRLLPFLRELGFKNVEKTLAASALSLESAVQSLDHYSQKLKEQALQEEESQKRLELLPYREAAPAQQLAILQEFFPMHLSRRKALQLQRFALFAESGRSMQIGEQYFIKDRDSLICRQKGQKPESQYMLCRDGEILQSAFGEFRVEILPANLFKAKSSQSQACFSEELLGKTLQLRSWEAGERMQLFGSGGKKKISDILKDEKLPADLKQQYPLLLFENTVLWIPGIKRSKAFLVKENDKNMLMISYSKAAPKS